MTILRVGWRVGVLLGACMVTGSALADTHVETIAQGLVNPRGIALAPNGWLYVAEGSNLGAAFLLKEAIRLELSETFGARHLAGAPEGRGLHWRTFTAALDSIALSQAEEDRVIAGAEAAFRRVQGLVDDIFGERFPG